MGLWDQVTRFLALTPATLEERAIDSFVDHPGLTEQLMAVQGLTPRPWRVASLKEALGFPAIFRAVSLISNTTGALSLQGYRNGRLLPPEQRPRLIVRPDPFKTPRFFFQRTAYFMATRGEAWWWVAKRDQDGMPLSLITIHPQEVNVTEDPADLRYPIIEWRGRRMRNEDMRWIPFLPDESGLRGMGPLQVCGAAVSVAVEAQEWAANFFAGGGYPSIYIKSAVELGPDPDDPDGETEAEKLRNAWMDVPNNLPRVVDPRIEEVKEFGANPQGAQMLQARDYQNGDAARMFGMPASLLDYSTPGSSLTYQNLEMEFAKWVRAGLWPNYLEAIEQEMSDLLTRSHTARFNIDALQRADSKTRFEVYKLGVESGVLTVDEARRMEGLDAGDVETAVMPFAPPQAIPASLPIQQRAQAEEVRCDGMHVKRRSGVPSLQRCNRLLSTTGAFVGRCPRCKKEYAAA